MTITSPPPGTPPYPYRRRPFLSRSFLPLALITLGVVFLLGNLVSERGRAGLVLLGLGVAFLIGRLTTGRYGYAVPAGLLIALSAHFSLPFLASTQSSGGWFFTLLGIGFVLVYVIGMQPGKVWPLFPAVVLVLLGMVLFGLSALSPLASLSWIVSFWPAALVLLGLWLMFRDHLPETLRRPIGTLGGLGLLVYGLLAAASSVAAGGALARTGIAPGFGMSPYAETLPLDLPIRDGQTLTVSNSNGSTTIRAAANAGRVHVLATRHFSAAGQGPDVSLVPTSDGVALQSSESQRRFPFFGGSSWVDYVIELPAGARVRAMASSGTIDIDGLSSDVSAATSSGQISLSNLTGAVDAQASSGTVQLSNVAGAVMVNTNSGSIHGSQLQHVSVAQTSSGAIQLDGTFTDSATVRTSSGSVSVRLLSGSAVRLNVQTGSGSIGVEGLPVTGVSQQRNAYSATVGSPAADATLQIQTSSGAVHLSS